MRDVEIEIVTEVITDLHVLGRQLNPSVLHIRAAADKLRGLLRRSEHVVGTCYVCGMRMNARHASDLAAEIAVIDRETA